MPGAVPPASSTRARSTTAASSASCGPIRTSGEKRLSNYLLWQCAYTEFVFTDVLWPDFGRWDLIDAIVEYQGRKRRFGGVGDAAR